MLHLSSSAAAGATAAAGARRAPAPAAAAAAPSRRARAPAAAPRAAADDAAAAAAAASSTSAPAAAPAAAPKPFAPPMPALAWPVDNETPRQVFAANGPLAERLNGRLAMLGFVAAAMGERADGTPALAQLGDDLLGPVLLALMFTVASIAPKIVSGTPLATLHATATGDNLKGEGAVGQALGFFDAGVELLNGRAAMVGLVALVVVEAVTGKAFF